MKRLFLVCATCLALAGAPTPRALAQDAAVATQEAAQPATAELTAAQVIEKSRAVYAGLAVYRGSCSVLRDSVIGTGNGPLQQNVSIASATFDFERGKYLSIEGTYSGGRAFRAFWTPEQTWMEQGAKGEAKRETIESDATLSAREKLLAGLTGVTGGAASILPSALAGDNWSNPFPSSKSTLELRPPQDLGSTSCYVVVATRPNSGDVDTYWIERNSFLLRRLTRESGAHVYDNMPAADGVNTQQMRVDYSSNTYAFANQEVSQTIQ